MPEKQEETEKLAGTHRHPPYSSGVGLIRECRQSDEDRLWLKAAAAQTSYLRVTGPRFPASRRCLGAWTVEAPYGAACDGQKWPPIQAVVPLASTAAVRRA